MIARFNTKMAIAAGVSIAALALGAPPASAQITGWSSNIEGLSNGTVTIEYTGSTNMPPVPCVWKVRDLDQAGVYRTGGKIHNTTTFSNFVTIGKFASGHELRVELICHDRSGYYQTHTAQIFVQ